MRYPIFKTIPGHPGQLVQPERCFILLLFFLSDDQGIVMPTNILHSIRHGQEKALLFMKTGCISWCLHFVDVIYGDRLCSEDHLPNPDRRLNPVFFTIAAVVPTLAVTQSIDLFKAFIFPLLLINRNRC